MGSGKKWEFKKSCVRHNYRVKKAVRSTVLRNYLKEYTYASYVTVCTVNGVHGEGPQTFESKENNWTDLSFLTNARTHMDGLNDSCQIKIGVIDD